ncbi:MAG: autotransporter outer membrane beta-barrel domain-containing protein, partial [Pseudolabrys sp.]|nr:autotransporter outer membrane beta-barrel domain-containing protein [Pseudolabrys sp.]
GSATASFELGRRDVYKLAPYVKADFTSATLDDYSETGASAQLLSYDKMTASSTSVGVGLRGSIDVPVSFGTLTPTARVEYKEIMQDGYSQNMYYADLGPAAGSAFGQPSTVKNMTTVALGLNARAFGGMMVALEYGFMFGSDAYKAQSIRAALRVPF